MDSTKANTADNENKPEITPQNVRFPSERVRIEDKLFLHHCPEEECGGFEDVM